MIRNIEITKIEGSKIKGVKRQYLPFYITWECPECGLLNLKNYENCYMEYHVFGSVYKESLYCRDCGHNVDVDLVTEVVLSKYYEKECKIFEGKTPKSRSTSKVIRAGYDHTGSLWWFDTTEQVVFQDGDYSENRGHNCDSLEQAREMLAHGVLP